MQHVRSFTSETMSDGLRAAGFEVQVCTPTNLAWFQMGSPGPALDWSARTLGSRLRRSSQRILDRIFPRPFQRGREFSHWTGKGPHLTAFAVKPD